jgi:hypothetical protein
LFVVRHFERLRRRPQIERRGLNRNHDQTCCAHRDPGFGFNMRRGVDHDQVRPTNAIVDPLCRAPTR